MPELRRNFMTKEWVVIATERAKRPDQMVVKHERKPPLSFSPNCPFCPGNENVTPPEILRVPDGPQVESVQIRFYNNLREPRDCQSSRKSYKTSHTVG